jgi:hypothetical protein
LKRDVCYALGSSWARPGAARPLLDEYALLDGRDDVCAALTRAAILTSVERVADDAVFAEVAEIATDGTRGVARGMALLALGNMRGHRAAAVGMLRTLLADDNVAGFAALGLVKLDARETLHDVVALTRYGDPLVRRTASRVAMFWLSAGDEQYRRDGGEPEPPGDELRAAGVEGELEAGLDVELDR